MRANNVYDCASLLKNLGVFLLMLVVMRFTRGAGFVIFVPLVFLAAIQNKTGKLLLYMLVMVAASIGNGILMPKSMIFGVTQKGLVVLMAVVLMSRLSGQRHSPFLTPFMGLLPYLLFMALISIQGWNPLLSYLKLFLFATCYFAYYGMANTIIRDGRFSERQLRNVYLALACFLLFGSVCLLPFPGISQMSPDAYLASLHSGGPADSLFCGIAFHPQSLGPLVAIFFVMLLTDMLFSIGKTDRLMMALMACCPVLIYKTSSRTALGTMAAGTLFAFYHFMHVRQVSSRWRGKVVSFALILSIVGSMALVVLPSGRAAVTHYLLKRDVESHDFTMENITSSRQGLMDRAMYNFRQKPIMGNGFQVGEWQTEIGTDDIKALLSAPIEKGVWVTAILEEGGVFGFVLFVLFGLAAVVKLTRLRAYSSASILFTIFVLNLGEFTFFSMSGIGGFYWCLCFIGSVLDARRLSREAIPYERLGW